MGKLYGYYLKVEYYDPKFDERVKDELWFHTPLEASQETQRLKAEFGKNLKRAEILDIQEIYTDEDYKFE